MDIIINRFSYEQVGSFPIRFFGHIKVESHYNAMQYNANLDITSSCHGLHYDKLQRNTWQVSI